MKRIILVAASLLAGLSAFAQGPLTKYLEGRFGGEEEESVFIEKGRKAFGISGGYRSFNALGDDATNAGFSLLSLLNIGNGQLKIWNVAPSFSTFIADNLSLGVAVNYNGYAVDTDIRLDFRDIVSSTSEALNVTVSNRSMRHHSGGVSLVLRKYVPFFGSKTVAVFAEGRLYGDYGATYSTPREGNTKAVNRERLSQGIDVGLKAGGGVAFKMKDNTAITLSIPIFGIAFSHTMQDKITKRTEQYTDPDTGNVYERALPDIVSKSHMNSFNASRSTDLLGIQFGFVRYM